MRHIDLNDPEVSLSALVEDAASGQPSVVTREGHKLGIILSYEAWERLTHVPSFGRLLMSAPLGPDNDLERDPRPFHETDR